MGIIRHNLIIMIKNNEEIINKSKGDAAQSHARTNKFADLLDGIT